MKSYLFIILYLLCFANAIAQTASKNGISSKQIRIAFPLREVYVTSPFGARTDPLTKKTSKHNGLDLKAYYEPTYAMLFGKVIAVGNCSRAGIYVTLQHGNFTVSYCHLSKTSVLMGNTVQPGDVVGITGNTGRSTGPHLHLTCKYQGKCINPNLILDFLKRNL